jgi:hypothetical protein
MLSMTTFRVEGLDEIVDHYLAFGEAQLIEALGGGVVAQFIAKGITARLVAIDVDQTVSDYVRRWWSSQSASRFEDYLIANADAAYDGILTDKVGMSRKELGRFIGEGLDRLQKLNPFLRRVEPMTFAAGEGTDGPVPAFAFVGERAHVAAALGILAPAPLVQAIEEPAPVATEDAEGPAKTADDPGKDAPAAVAEEAKPATKKASGKKAAK